MKRLPTLLELRKPVDAPWMSEREKQDIRIALERQWKSGRIVWNRYLMERCVAGRWYQDQGGLIDRWDWFLTWPTELVQRSLDIALMPDDLQFLRDYNDEGYWCNQAAMLANYTESPRQTCDWCKTVRKRLVNVQSWVTLGLLAQTQSGVSKDARWVPHVRNSMGAARRALSELATVEHGMFRGAGI